MDRKRKRTDTVKRGMKTREKRTLRNVSQRLATDSFFLIRKTEREGFFETAYENQYSDALLQAPCFNILSCGETVYQGGRKISYGHLVKEIAAPLRKFQFVTEGEGTLSCGGKEYEMRKGDIFLEPVEKEFGIGAKDGTKLVRLYFDFSAGGVESLLLTPEFLGCTPCLLRAPDSAPLLVHFRDLIALGKENPPDAAFAASKIIYSFVLDLGRIRKHVSPDIRYRLYSVLEPLTFRKYDLDALAESAGMSRRTLNRFFLKQFGMTPVEYIRIQKINFAAHALKTTRIPVSELARICAYSSQSYFTRDFRRLMGKSPSEYRAFPEDGRKEESFNS